MSSKETAGGAAHGGHEGAAQGPHGAEASVSEASAAVTQVLQASMETPEVEQELRWLCQLLRANQLKDRVTIDEEQLSANAPPLRGVLEVSGMIPALLKVWIQLACDREPEKYKEIITHLQDPRFAEGYPLHLQEYGAFFAETPYLELPVWEAMRETSWAREVLQTLRLILQPSQGAEVSWMQVRGLCQRLDGIVEEAAQLVTQIGILRRWKEQHQLSVVQGEACMAATMLREPSAFQGVDIVDLGCAEGSIVDYFRGLGAVASGVELDDSWRASSGQVSPDDGASHGIVQENFMSLPSDRRFTLITGTGFFESGAFIWPDLGRPDTQRFFAERDVLLAQVAQSLAPGGLLVLRNFTEPILFRKEAIERAGLRRHHVLVPTAAARYTGRSVCFLKVDGG